MKTKIVVGFIFKDDKLLLIKHKRKNMWLPVGGHVEKDETDKEALLREIKEEVSLDVEVAQKPFFILEEPNETTAHFICLYKSGDIKINPDEIIDHKFLTKEEITKFDLNEDVKKVSLDAFLAFAINRSLQSTKIKNLIFVAHPDDELIWFSSILKKPESGLVICFDNIIYSDPVRNADYAKKMSRILNEYRKIIPVIWLRIPKVTEPRIFGDIDKDILEILEVDIISILNTLQPKKVYTHNPWGEYGHSEHKAIHNILKKFRKDIIFPEVVIENAVNSEEYKKNIDKISFFSEEATDPEFKRRFTNFYKEEGIWTMKDIEGYPLFKERFSNYKKNNIKSFLLVSDNNFIDGLIAQINSIHRNFRDFKIYLIHQLSNENLQKVKPFIYKEERYEDKFFSHLENSKGHITKINFAKFCPDFIEEDIFFYMDTDVIVIKEFPWEYPKTINCESRTIDLDKEQKYKESIKLMQEYILENKGIIEIKNQVKVYLDGAFFANKNWLINVLRPLIIDSSKKMPQAEKHWYGLGFFNAAIDIMHRPVEKWHMNQLLNMVDDLNDLENVHLIHFVGKEKPWLKKYINFYSIWEDYYLNGVIRSKK